MQIFKVGGAVRDRLLARPVHDTDWVVVGSTPEAMVEQGFVPVGRDFPVFLHPRTHEEYALARTERKCGTGYRGFVVHASPGVTLEQDLARRDLTINAIAAPPDWPGPEDGTGDHAGKGRHDGPLHDPALLAALVDPFGGVADLRARVLRHVSDAFREDPVRILRLARFAAQLPGFTVAPATMALLRTMVQAGEVGHLVSERVWQEISRALMQPQPARMVQVLHDCAALGELLPPGLRAMLPLQWTCATPALEAAAACTAPLPVRFACLCHDLGLLTGGDDGPGDGALPPEGPVRHGPLPALDALCQHWRVPTDCRAVAHLLAHEGKTIAQQATTLGAAATLDLLLRCDALRRPQRFSQLLLAWQCTARASGASGARGTSGACGTDASSDAGPASAALTGGTPLPPADAAAASIAGRLQSALDAALAVPTADTAREAAQKGLRGADIGRAVDAVRVRAIAQMSEPVAAQTGGAGAVRSA